MNIISVKEEDNYIINNPSLKINYEMNANSKSEDNNLSYTNSIIKPNFNKIEEYHQLLNKNEIVLYKNIDNKIVREKILFWREIYGNGNFYYRSLSFYLTNSQEYFNYFRNYIYNYLKVYKEIFNWISLYKL